MKKIVLVLFLCGITFSWVTKKIKNNIENIHKTDTVYISKETIKTYEVKDTITVKSPCYEKDNLKYFLHHYNIGTGKV